MTGSNASYGGLMSVHPACPRRLPSSPGHTRRDALACTGCRLSEQPPAGSWDCGKRLRRLLWLCRRTGSAPV